MNSKLIFLDLLLLAAVLLFSWSLTNFFAAANLNYLSTSRGMRDVALFAIALLFLGLTAAVSLYFNRTFRNTFLAAILATAVSFAVFYRVESIVVSAALSLLLLVALLIFKFKMDRESDDRIKFSVRTIFVPPLKTFFALLLLLLSMGFFFPYQARVSREGFETPEILISRIVDIVGERTVDLLVSEIVQSSKLGDEQAVFTEIPEEVWEAGLTDTLEQEFGVRIDRVPQSSADLLAMVKPSIEQKIRAEIDHMLSPIAPYIPAVVSLAIFLTLLPFVSLLAFFAAPFLALIFFILEKINFTDVETQTVPTSRPVLS